MNQINKIRNKLQSPLPPIFIIKNKPNVDNKLLLKKIKIFIRKQKNDL